MAWFKKNKNKKKKAEDPTANAISTKQKLEDTIKINNEAMMRSEKQILSLKLEAKKALKMEDRRKAKLIASKIKMRKKEISKLDGANLMLEQQVFQIETQGHNAGVFKALDEGNNVLQQLAEEGDIDRFEDIKEKHEELQEKNDEISDFFINYGIEQSEDCEEELAALEAEMIEDEAKGIIVYDTPIEGIQSKTKQEIINKEEVDILAQMN